MRASAFAASTAWAKVSIGSCRSAIRVVPAWLASPMKSHRHRPWGQIAVATPDRRGQLGQGPPLLDVQLHERAESAYQLRVCAERVGVRAGRGDRPGEGLPVPVGQGERPLEA